MIQILIAVALTFVFAQILKLIIDETKTDKWHWKVLRSDGGMPSTHSALAASLSAAIFFDQGITALFIAAAVFSLIIMRDAFGVRLQVEEHARMINRKFKTKFAEGVGHTFTEVVSGALIGILISGLVYMF